MNGLGIRSQADLLAPAWTGCFVQACESFTRPGQRARRGGTHRVLPTPRTPLRRRRVQHGRRTLRIIRVLQHPRPLERTRTARALGGHARARGATGRRRARYGSALARRAPSRSPSLDVGGLERPHALMPAPTTRAMRSTRAAPGGDAGRGNEAATRGPNGVHGCDPSPSARIVSGDVRYRTGVRSPTPHKVLRAHERRVQGDDSHLHAVSYTHLTLPTILLV